MRVKSARVPGRTLLVVAAGGAVGTGLRYALTHLTIISGSATLIANLAGAALLGLLVGWAPWRGSGREAQHVEAFLGAGLMGGFTTYSALALEVVTGDGWLGLAYGLTTVVSGLLAVIAGLLAGRAVAERRER